MAPQNSRSLLRTRDASILVYPTSITPGSSRPALGKRKMVPRTYWLLELNKDFNNVTSQQDKNGGNPYPNWLVNGFIEVLEDCGLYDLELNGYPFTWERRDGGLGGSSIDRALVFVIGLISANMRLTGCQVAINAPRLSHMLFADDSYVYCKANDNEASNVLQLLRVYEMASGQQVNYAKSSIFLSKNMSVDTRARLCEMLGMMAKFWWKSQSSARSKGVTWAQSLCTRVRRSIGRGHDVSILQDTWLPDLDNPYVTSESGLVNQRVSSLFLVGDLAWDFELVEDMFEARDRNLIVSIQLSATAVKDDWYWCREPSWFYTVKSAYKLLQEMSSASVNVENQARWKLLWQLDVPPKVHHFIWRAILGCLPTKSQLNTKHVNVDLMCPFGNFTSESIHHVLLQCGFAQSCWRVSGVNMAAGLGVDFSSWFFNVAETQSRVLACEAAIVGWKIWPARNDVLWNNKSCSAMEVVRSARVVLDQWKNAQSQKCGALLVNNINNVFERWRKPVFNTVKVNVD
uniref:Reverse transcriptase zinc-binding domain-containing protein n=1 Tax=Cannabis sativa TaxID=3483 RepID=A0A803PIM4_CANSA